MEKRNTTDILIEILFAAFAAAQVLSWRFPWIAFTGRLSTSPVVVMLCCAGFAAVRVRDWRLAKVVSVAAIPVLLAGRFTFHVLGGAPPFDGLNLFEVRCISELFVLMLIAVLCLRHPLDKTGRRVLITMLLGFLSDAYDTPFFSLRKIRCAELLLCGMSIALWFSGGFWGGMSMLSAALLVPWAMMISGERNNKNLVALFLVMKALTDIGESSFLHTQELFILFILLDCAVAVFAFLGRREDFSLALIIQVMMVLAGFILFCCSTVDRGSPYFAKTSYVWCCELTLYTSYLLHGFGRGWSWAPLGSVLHSMFEIEEEHPDDDWKAINDSADAESCDITGSTNAAEESETIEDSVAKGLLAYRTRKAILYLAVVIISAVSISSAAGTYVSSADAATGKVELTESTDKYLTYSEDRLSS